MKYHLAASITLILLCNAVHAGSDRKPSEVWNPDKGSQYVNPVLNADYSDPDVCRVGEDFYMTSSSIKDPFVLIEIKRPIFASSSYNLQKSGHKNGSPPVNSRNTNPASLASLAIRIQ